jgi:two-component system NtrC family sensor kinase
MVQTAKLSALGQLVAGVAHELNNPLTVLLSGIELLADDAPEPWRPRLTMLEDAVERAQHIVEGLLTFGRRVRLERQPVDLAELVDKVLAVTAADLRLAGVRIEQETEPGVPRIWADAHQLQQVLVNIVTNAKQAMAEVEGERRLRIVLRRAGPDHARIRVEDTGPGIPAELLPIIFDPFVTTKGASGTGLGLSISYGIIREHGGEITVESAPGAGTAFTIELPIGAPAVREPAASPGPAVRLEGRHVVVVEDNEGLQSLMCRHLERAGCAISGFPNAEAALAGFPDRVDLVLFDFYLTGMSGLEFSRKVVARYPRLAGRLLLMTGGLLPEAAQELVANGAWRLLTKPFSRQQLLDAVGDTLR